MYSLIPLVLLAAGALGAAPHAAAATTTSSTSAGLLIPLYIYPGSAWTSVEQLRQSDPTVPITVVINPGNGPGTTYDPNYGKGVAQMQAAGITVLGYVYTEYGARSISSVESDIATYKQLYGVNGIFLDQMSNVPGYESYYSTLTSYAHSDGLSPVVGNPGTSVPSTFYGTVDVIVIYENSGIPSQATLASSTAGGSPSEFASISYGVQTPTQSMVNQLAGYVSYVYVTNGQMPDPYDALPSYLPALTTDLASTIPVTAPKPPTTAQLVVQSVNSNGASFSGMWTTVTTSSNGQVVASGFTPLTFNGTIGTQYTVTIDNYQSYIFTQWQSGGGTNPSVTLTLSQATTLTAVFSTTPPSITVSSVTTSGTSFTGMWTLIYQGKNLVDTGFTALSYQGTYGSTYTVCIDNYRNYVFSNWSSGSTSSCQTITLTQNTNLVAEYNT